MIGAICFSHEPGCRLTVDELPNHLNVDAVLEREPGSVGGDHGEAKSQAKS